jgi:hypothetical protein
MFIDPLRRSARYGSRRCFGRKPGLLCKTEIDRSFDKVGQRENSARAIECGHERDEKDSRTVARARITLCRTTSNRSLGKEVVVRIEAHDPNYIG